MPPAWYVTDPSTGRVQSVEADAECTARWVAWTAWYGSARIDARGRKYLTAEERACFLAAIRAHRQQSAHSSDSDHRFQCGGDH